MTDRTIWRHDRDNIRMLHNAHADHIEAKYREFLSMPGNPMNVETKRFGQTRTFYAKGDRFENRAIFSGNETLDQFDEVLNHFAEKGVDCNIEINPANFYRTDPFSWNSEGVPYLLDRGCTIEGFRTVWVRDKPLQPEEQTFSLDCRPVDYEQFAKVAPIIHGEPPEEDAPAFEPDSGVFYYVGFHGDQPVANSVMYFNGESGYLQSAITDPDFRRRGYHTQMTRMRVRDAFEMGAVRMFTVTDFNNQSSYNQQRNGFQLAYNYLLLVRKPKPLDERQL